MRRPVHDLPRSRPSGIACLPSRRVARPRSFASLAVFLYVVLTALLPTVVKSATNTDTGFVLDGKTTYCVGVHATQEPLKFKGLAPSSAGKCPIDVHLSVDAASVEPRAPFVVHWSASAHTGALATNLFPTTVGASTTKPRHVVASWLRACKLGTNCASVIEPSVAGDEPPATDTGAFDASGKKTLRSYTFQFPNTGDSYVIIGKVVLPGDRSFDISTQVYVTFLRINVGAGDASEEAGLEVARVGPPDVGSVPRHSVAADAKLQALSPSPPAPVERESRTPSSSGVQKPTITVVNVVGVVAVLVVVAYAVVVIKTKRWLIATKQRQETTGYALRPDGKLLDTRRSSMATISAFRENTTAWAPPGDMTDVYSVVGSSLSLSAAGSASHSEPRAETSTHASEDINQRSCLALLELSRASSCVSSLGGLHDSFELIPPLPRRKTRDSAVSWETESGFSVLLDSFEEQDTEPSRD